MFEVTKKEMKYADPNLLSKAFIKVIVRQSTKKVYFKDLKMYKKLKKRSIPCIPTYDGLPINKADSDSTDTESSQILSHCSTI